MYRILSLLVALSFPCTAAHINNSFRYTGMSNNDYGRGDHIGKLVLQNGGSTDQADITLIQWADGGALAMGVPDSRLYWDNLVVSTETIPVTKGTGVTYRCYVDGSTGLPTENTLVDMGDSVAKAVLYFADGTTDELKLAPSGGWYPQTGVLTTTKEGTLTKFGYKMTSVIFPRYRGNRVCQFMYKGQQLGVLTILNETGDMQDQDAYFAIDPPVVSVVAGDNGSWAASASVTGTIAGYNEMKIESDKEIELSLGSEYVSGRSWTTTTNPGVGSIFTGNINVRGTVSGPGHEMINIRITITNLV